ncbi:MAG TPA: right-handed parallel beta-helix repeat-containing protein [Thermoplasmata archaeon]
MATGFPAATPANSIRPALTSHNPILIEGDAEFNAANGVTGGSGTPADPYVIENWEINASAANGIDIRNTTAPFSIRNVTVQGGAPPNDGIRFTNVSHGEVGASNLSISDAGIRLLEVSDISISSADITTGWEGIHMERAQRVSIADVVIRSFYWGIEARQSSNLTILRANVSGPSTDGIAFFDGEDVVIGSSDISGYAGGWGIEVNGVRRFSITGNRVSGMGVGVDAILAQEGTIEGNSLNGNGGGILVRLATNVTVDENDLTANHGGLRLEGATDVEIYHNRFVENTRQGVDDNSGASAWDGGYPTGGNFWSDYQGWDDCGGPAQDVCPGSDGLGDTPYAIDSNNRDRYPLVPVNPPNAPPVASFYAKAPSPYPGEPLSFVAVDSYDPEGWPLAYGWDFGDGATATASVPDAIHAYATEGTYTVTLTVTDVRHATAAMTETLAILPIPVLALVTLEHPAGFRLPVPVGWTRQLNVTEGSNVTELVMSGSVGGLPASILVDTDRDPTVRETHDYLDRFVTETLAQIRVLLPSAYLDGAPDFRTIANHSAVSFVIRYTGLPVVQKVAYVVSEAHTRSWFLLLTAGDANFVILNATFERMLAGFEITLPPNPTGIFGLPILVFGGIGAGAAAAVVVAVLVFRTRRRRPPKSYAAEPSGAPGGPVGPEAPRPPGL